MTLSQFHVRPDRWSRGIGSAPHASVLAAWGESRVRPARLEVHEHNLRARTFYARHGRHPDGNVVRAPDSAHVPLRLDLPS
jgi:GNAT superfamily N-acetyltransferase